MNSIISQNIVIFYIVLITLFIVVLLIVTNKFSSFLIKQLNRYNFENIQIKNEILSSGGGYSYSNSYRIINNNILELITLFTKTIFLQIIFQYYISFYNFLLYKIFSIDIIDNTYYNILEYDYDCHQLFYSNNTKFLNVDTLKKYKVLKTKLNNYLFNTLFSILNNNVIINKYNLHNLNNNNLNIFSLAINNNFFLVNIVDSHKNYQLGNINCTFFEFRINNTKNLFYINNMHVSTSKMKEFNISLLSSG